MIKKLLIITLYCVVLSSNIFGMSNINLTDEEQQYLNILKTSYEKVCFKDKVKGYECFAKLKFSNNILNDLKKIVLKCGAEGLVKQGRSPLSALHAAIYKEDIESTSYILSFETVKERLLNLPIIAQDKNVTPLVLSIKLGNIKIAKLLVENGAEVCFSYLEKQFDDFLEYNMALKTKDKIKIRKSFNQFSEWYTKYSKAKQKKSIPHTNTI